MKHIFSKSIVFLVMLTIGSVIVYGQQSEWKTHQIKFTPLRTINWIAPGLELSYELNHGKYSTQLSIAYLTYFIKIYPRVSYCNGYRLNLEEKRFFKIFNTSKIRNYLSAEVGYHQIDMTVKSGFIPHEYLGESLEIQRENIYWDFYDLNRQSITGNLKCGMQFMFNHFTFDVAVGIGITHQNVKHFNIRNPEDKITYEFEDILSPLFYDEGKYFIPNFPITFKIGVAF